MTLDIPSYKEPVTKECVVEFITKVMDRYDQLKDLSDLDSLSALMEVFSNSYFSLKDYRKEMSEVLLRKNYIDISSVAMKNLKELGHFSSDQVWTPTYYVYNTLWNFSDFDRDIATAITFTNIPGLLLTNIMNKSYLEDLDNPICYYLMKASVSIVHNAARFQGNQRPFDIKDFKSTLVGLIRRKHSDFLGLISMLTLSVLMGETELELLEEGKNAITSLIDHIKTALKKPDKRYDGLMVWELVNGLRCLSVSDNMKRIIFEKGALPVLVDVLNQSLEDENVEKSLETIWNLCFDKEIEEVLKADYNIKDVIKSYENNSSAGIRRCYSGVTWMLEREDRYGPQTLTTSTTDCLFGPNKKFCKFDVFFSYSTIYKSIIVKIQEELMKSNIRVWMKEDELREASLEDMIDGIENSMVFVMGLSEGNRTSPDCRTEVEYALHLNKPIVPLIMECEYKLTGWMANIVGTTMQYDFSERHDFHASLSTFHNNLNNILGQSNEESLSDLEVRFTNVAIASRWSRDDIDLWLQDSHLGHLRSRFMDIEGTLFESLIDMNSEAPDFLYRTLKKDYRMTLLDILKFRIAIKSLRKQ